MAKGKKTPPSKRRFEKFVNLIEDFGGKIVGPEGNKTVYLFNDSAVEEYTQKDFVGKGKNYLVVYAGQTLDGSRAFFVGTLEEIRENIIDTLTDAEDLSKVERIFDLFEGDGIWADELDFEIKVSFPGLDDEEDDEEDEEDILDPTLDDDDDVSDDSVGFFPDEPDEDDDAPIVTESHEEEEID